MTNGWINTDWVETVSRDGLHLMLTRLEVRVPTSEGRKFITCGLARKTYVVKDGTACQVSSYALGRDLGSPDNYDFEIVSATGALRSGGSSTGTAYRPRNSRALCSTRMKGLTMASTSSGSRQE
ncbi:hypothetical protein [Streptomyces scabiei]|uniref:hypothetical protein n=1 Tax=Streptomyces scabiei TaxID=1930 RepID=UPI001FF1BA2B|nr:MULTISPECIES: hypothetical protein [unclassified Streptomyces]